MGSQQRRPDEKRGRERETPFPPLLKIQVVDRFHCARPRPPSRERMSSQDRQNSCATRHGSGTFLQWGTARSKPLTKPGSGLNV